MAYRVELTPAALRDLRRLPKEILRRIDARILALADNPRPPGAKKLEGEDDLYRLRVGDYRILYSVDDKTSTGLVARIGHRQDIYR